MQIHGQKDFAVVIAFKNANSIPLMQIGSSSTKLFSYAVQELHFLGQETSVKSFPAWSVSFQWSKRALHRMGIHQRRNSKGKPAKTHHANWGKN